MLPYRAQGAAMAIEDAAVLGNLLSRLTSAPQSSYHLGMLLKAYQRLRLSRTANTQETSALNKYIFHLPDGPEQVARDASMGKAMRAEEMQEVDIATGRNSSGSTGSKDGGHRARNQANANQWADRRKNLEQYGYDADAAVDHWWESEGEDQLYRLLGELVGSPETSTLSSGGSHRSVKKGFWRKVLGKKNEDE